MSFASSNTLTRNHRFAAWPYAAVLLAVWFVFYQPTLRALAREWYEHENFSYGFLIPCIFLYLLWGRREVFKESVAPSGWGAITFVGALVLGAAGSVLGEPFMSRVSLVLALIGIFQMFCGAAGLKQLAFPLCYLFLMIPPPYPVVKAVSYHLRMFDARVATYLVQAVGVPVYQDTYFMHLPDITLEVADVCSGIASLFAMIALGAIYVYNLPVRISTKIFVLSGAFVCPLIANLFRLFLVTVSVYYYGPVMLGAFFHTFTGTFTFVLSLAMFLWVGETARRRYAQPQYGLTGERISRSAPPSVHDSAPVSRFVVLTSVVGSVLGAALVLYLLNERVPNTPLKAAVHLEEIAPNLAGFVAARKGSDEAYKDPRAEESLSRIYQSAESAIELFVGFSSRQSDDKRLQSPKLVFPKNWEYASIDNVEIPTAAGNTISAVELLTKKNEERTLVVFWYIVNGNAFSSDLRNRVELMKDSLLHGRSEGAVVRVATPLGRFESQAEGRARLITFANSLYPELVRTLPK